MLSFLISLVVTLLVLGLVWYLIQAFLPVDPRIKNAIGAALALIAILWLLGPFLGFGAWGTPVYRVR